CEELPASACREAEVQLHALCRSHLGVEPAAVYVGPRRLALLADDVPAEPPVRWLKGPPVSLRAQAAAGFAKRYGVSVDELEERDGFLGASVAGQRLPERLAAIVGGFSFGKSMVWQAGGPRFSRPVRWLCAKLGDETIEVPAAGIRATGGRTYGHRFTCDGPAEVLSAEAYLATLRSLGVEPDQRERERVIREGLDTLGCWSDPAGKLAEVVHLVELPIVLEGRFDDRFLQLPPRVVETAMQSHQRYFPLGGNRFAFVANGGDPAAVRTGNERILEGRLDDASFTFERDLTVGIEQLAERLGSITFFAGAGSFADKTARLGALAAELGGGEATREAARLAKADQAAELVREFPDLEGHIGGEYARAAGYPEAVCAAIDEQYLPEGPDSPVPATEAGRILAAADKIDNLRVAFELGKRPSGSRDPFGLRRAAIGLCRLAVEGGLAIRLELLGDEVVEFVLERLEGVLEIPLEFTRAARGSGAGELRGVARLAEALAGLPDDELGPLHTAYTRASRLAANANGAGSLDPALLTEPAEREVADAVAKADACIRAALEAGELSAALAAGAELGPLLDRFFAEVLVMAEDDAVRANRLRLLRDARDALGLLGDFSQIPR
ncbi:MAG: glycine--tRNA ligase subunit beta, partial [Gaiellaceae bacterium]